MWVCRRAIGQRQKKNEETPFRRQAAIAVVRFGHLLYEASGGGASGEKKNKTSQRYFRHPPLGRKTAKNLDQATRERQRGCMISRVGKGAAMALAWRAITFTALSA